MKTGFSFKGVHSYDFDGVAAVSTDDRPIVPDVKETTFSPLNRDGAYDFSAANPARREYYEDRIFQMKIKVKAADFTAMQRTLMLLSRWLKGSGDLVFDDTPNVKWAARIVEAIPYTPEREGHKAELDVKFRVQPFCEMMFNVIDGVILDSEIPLDSKMPIGINDYFTFRHDGSAVTTWPIVKNIGDVPVRPVITVEGAQKNFWIGDGRGNIIIFPKAALTDTVRIIIDCERFVVSAVKSNGGIENIMQHVSGSFFELCEGDNELMVTSLDSLTIEVQYTPKYMYNVDLNEMGFE